MGFGIAVQLVAGVVMIAIWIAAITSSEAQSLQLHPLRMAGGRLPLLRGDRAERGIHDGWETIVRLGPTEQARLL